MVCVVSFCLFLHDAELDAGSIKIGSAPDSTRLRLRRPLSLPVQLAPPCAAVYTQTAKSALRGKRCSNRFLFTSVINLLIYIGRVR